MSEELVAKLRSGFITDACGVPLRGSTERIMNEAADLIEQQAKELAEAQARVVLLRGVLDELVYLKDMKDHLEKLHAMGHGTDYDYYHKNKPRAWAEAREALASTDTAAQTLREKWTPVSERLPEPDTYVIVYNGKWCGLGKWVSGQYVEDIERWQDEHTEFIELLGPKISHWQPLPEPPKEKP